MTHNFEENLQESPCPLKTFNTNYLACLQQEFAAS